MTVPSLILVAAVLQPDADRAMLRWQELRDKREAKERLAEYQAIVRLGPPQ